jgi:hypothetical protein
MLPVMTARRFEFDASIRFRRTTEKNGKVKAISGEKQVTKQVGTPRRTVRVADELWSAAQQIAEARGEDLSLVIRRALEDYVATAADAVPPQR